MIIDNQYAHKQFKARQGIPECRVKYIAFTLLLVYIKSVKLGSDNEWT